MTARSARARSKWMSPNCGGKRRNMSNAKRKRLAGTGRGPAGKTAVVGAKDRATNQVAAQVVQCTARQTLQGCVKDHAAEDATVCTDDAEAYETPALRARGGQACSQRVRAGQGSRERGVESLRATLKRAREGTFHKISPKHLNRYVTEFAGKHNVRASGTLAQMTALVAGLVGKRLMYRGRIAANGLPSGARS